MLRFVRRAFENEREALLGALGTLTSSACSLNPGKSWTAPEGIVPASDPGRPTGLVLRSGSLYWVVEEALATMLLSKVLRLEASLPDQSKEPSSAISGSVAAIAEFLARHTTLGPVRFTPASLPREHGLYLSFQLEVGGQERYSIWCAIDPNVAFPAKLGSGRNIAHRGDNLPVSIPLVLAALAFPGEELSALSKGDAILLGRSALVGEAHLSPPGVDWGWQVRIERDTDHRINVVLGDKRGDLPFMPSDTTLSDLALEAPVLVRVELGSVELAARAWNELNAGDTVALGVGLGNPVTLRVGTKVVGRGELVDIEGELGVRLLERND